MIGTVVNSVDRASRLESRLRDAHLDLLRVVAVSSVVIYHLVQMSPVPFHRLSRITALGGYGVDLFFVLSGWLIGGLYWREKARFGDVDLLRFWLRRWLRTIPPYLAALLFSWLAVYFGRHERFDWGYLCFIQNYYHNIPFFLVSWSLCIEEHFYLFVPLMLIFTFNLRYAITALFAALIILPPVIRSFMCVGGTFIDNGDFGYTWTATHLRMEGLLLGFWAAYIANLHPSKWERVRIYSPWIGLFSGTTALAIIIFSKYWTYSIGLTLLAIALSALLVFLLGLAPGRIASSRVVNMIALASYSIYLTHALMLHIARQVLNAMPFLPKSVYFPLALALITSFGLAFYFLVERTSIQIRDRFAPRRGNSGSGRLTSGSPKLMETVGKY